MWLGTGLDRLASVAIDERTRLSENRSMWFVEKARDEPGFWLSADADHGLCEWLGPMECAGGGCGDPRDGR
jgi:hypothetical protein